MAIPLQYVAFPAVPVYDQIFFWGGGVEGVVDGEGVAVKDT